MLCCASLSLLLSLAGSGPAPAQEAPAPSAAEAARHATGVCPPFQLRNAAGEVVDPVAGVNAGDPYSPKQTCGACHNYALITEGYHFMQGKGEPLSPRLESLYRWVLSPGDYGGRW